MLKEAEPPDNAAVPRVLPPSLKVMVPVAVLGMTLAVKAIDRPSTEGFMLDVILVKVLVFLTVCVQEFETLLA